VTSKSRPKLSKRGLNQMRPMFGPPPVLRSESHVQYMAIYDRYIDLLDPQDVLELTLLTHLVNDLWLIKRYMRHQTLGIERWHQQSLAFQTQRQQSQDARKESSARRKAKKMTLKPADITELVHLEDNAESVVSDIDEIADRRPTELEHNHALEQGSAFQEQLDKWLTTAKVRFYKTLELFEHYREGLGQRLRQVTDQIIDAEFKEVDADRAQVPAPPLVPSDQTATSTAREEGAAPTS
jgi:hypothetical protein